MNRPYKCAHGICTHTPSCYGGVCPDAKPTPMAYQFPDNGRVTHIDSLLHGEGYVARNGNEGMHTANHNYPYCATGCCNYYESCSRRGECVMALAAVGKASDDELDDILEDSKQMMACANEGERVALRKAFFGTETLYEARRRLWQGSALPPILWSEQQDPSTFQPGEATIHKKSKPTFTFMWGFPGYELKIPTTEAESGPIGSGGLGVGTVSGTDWSRREEASDLRQPPILSTDSAERKNTPICSGVIDYFPRALAYVSTISKAGNDKHNPGEPLHWSKHKSTDHADCIARHLVERDNYDENGQRHSGMLAWRALALLEMELEAFENGVTVEELIDGYRAEAE